MILTDSTRMRDADNTAIHLMGVPSTWLMANAAAHVAEAAMEHMDGNRSAVIFCGSGNNGGDGIAAAAYLTRRGCKVRTLLVGRRDKLTPDTSEMERRLMEYGGALEDFDPDEPHLKESLDESGVIIDAIFGIGLNAEIRGRALRAVELINASKTAVVAADIPSGVEADSGLILGAAVRCDTTVTFTMAKPGHFIEPGCTYRGRLITVPIGIPSELLPKAGCGIEVLAGDNCLLPVRSPLSHKGDYGKLLLIAGSVGYTGAPTLCARAAVRSGAGLVYVGVPSAIYTITAVKSDESMPFPLESVPEGGLALAAEGELRGRLNNCDICVMGPGLGRSPDTMELVTKLLRDVRRPVVLDADALFAVSKDMSVLTAAQAPLVLTPHEGEFVRMDGDLSRGRRAAASEFVREHKCVLVLKGHRSICAFPDGSMYLADAGNPGMAKGGSGDVLAGIIGALMCQLPLKEAVTAAVAIHGKAGDVCAERLGEYSMTASDIIEALPEVTKSLTLRRGKLYD